MCGAACPGSCSALNAILEAYSGSGTHGAKRVLCARLPDLSCLVSHPGKCPCLRSHWKMWGVSLGRGGWPSQAALDAACHPAHPYLPPHPYRPPHHCRYDPHHPICRPYAEMAEYDEDSLLEDASSPLADGDLESDYAASAAGQAAAAAAASEGL